MQFRVFEDETLESCLLRLSHYRGYESFLKMVGDLEYDLRDGDPIGGWLPTKLSSFNIFKSKISSERKVRALWLLEKQQNIETLNLLKLALLTSDAKFSPNHTAVYQNGIDIPRALLRKNRTPICAECLKESEYIRHNWQFIPYSACHIHRCDLIHRCPKCHTVLNYQETESIVFCDCGYDLRESDKSRAKVTLQALSDWIVGLSVKSIDLPDEMSISERYGFVHWYINRYSSEDNFSVEDFISYATSFPENLFRELENQIQQAELTRVNQWQFTSFKDVFGDLLLACRQLPSRHISKNVVLRAVLTFFTKQVKQFSDAQKANFTSALLSPLEASALLSCTNEEVYRLFHHAEIKIGKGVALHAKLRVHQPAFTMDSVIITRLLRKNSERENLDLYLPSW